MSRHLSIHKVGLTASLLGLLPLLLTGFVTYRPNRIARGEAVFLWQTEGSVWVVLGLWAALLLLSLSALGQKRRSLIAAAMASILLPLLLAAAGDQAAFTTALAGPVARVSLGPGFWCSLFALLVVLTDAWQTSDEHRRALALMTGAAGCAVVWLFLTGRVDRLSIMLEFANRRERFFGELATHLALAFSSVGLALIIGVPLGLVAHRVKRLYNPTFFTLNTLQTMPSLALFGLLIPVLAALTARFPLLEDAGIRGIGAAPALIVLTVYSLLPVARNTHAGFATVSPAAVEAGTGMGMTRGQLLFKVEVPIASPVILNGIRVALVQAVGLTAVAALIGAGGLGVFIFQGLGQAANDLILLGAIPTILIAVAVDGVMGGLIAALRPEGLR